MKKKSAIKILLSLIVVVTIFHMGIIFKIIPANIAWGGKLENDQKMYVFESVSILINLFLGFVLLMKGGFIKSYFKQGIIHFILCVFIALFALNTIGNLLAKTYLEKTFSILTFVFSVLIWVSIRKQKD